MKGVNEMSLMDRQQMKDILVNYGRGLAEHNIPLTFIVGSEQEYGRLDVLNNTKPGNVLQNILYEQTSELFGIDKEEVDDLMAVYYLMTVTSILIETPSTSGFSGNEGYYIPDIKRNVYTLDREELQWFHRTRGIEWTDRMDNTLDRVYQEIETQIMLSRVRGLRLDWSKSKVVNPRTSEAFDSRVHVLPVDVIIGYKQGLIEKATKNVLKVTYMKGNGTEREQFVTLNRDIIFDVYKEDPQFAESFHQRSITPTIPYFNNKIDGDVVRGFWSLGDLGLSRFVDIPTRKISLARIIKVGVATESEMSTLRRYVNIDIEEVKPTFLNYIPNMTDEQLRYVKVELGCRVEDELTQHIEAQDVIYTVTFRRQLHDFMLMNQEIFKGYTGVKDNAYENSYNTSGNEVQFGSTMEIDF